MPLNKRIFIYEKCGKKEDRDINASMNILERIYSKELPQDMGKVKPVETM
ncbi:MAG: zinc ribbon domain-containing protein [Candidatus Micrarchaeaceae archaeon]